MRPLTEEETQTLFKKLAEYTGPSLKNLIAPIDNSPKADRIVRANCLLPLPVYD